MTILRKLLNSRDRHADRAVRYTEAWEHETFAEEQARWERGDRAYARICEEVRLAEGEEASRRASDAKAEWDACAAPQRQANDDAQRAHHVNSPASGIKPAPVRIPDQPALSNEPSKLEVE